MRTERVRESVPDRLPSAIHLHRSLVLVGGGGGAEDEPLGEAPPREPSSAALRNAPPW